MPTLEGKADPSAVRGILRAIRDWLFRRARTSAHEPDPGLEPEGGRGNTQPEPAHPQASRQRLAEAAACLERLDGERERLRDSHYGKTTENRIIWGELVELELQEIDEQMRHIGSLAGRSPQATAPSNLRTGGSHERDDS